MKEVKEVKVLVARYRNREDRKRARALLARKVLLELVNAARDQVGPQRWRNEGGLEAEEFLYDLDNGRGRRWLKEWPSRGPSTGRPAVSPRELMAQRFICLGIVALERMFSLGPGEAREEIAKKAARVFDQPPTAKTIEHWQDNQPLLSQELERWLVKSISAVRVDQPGGRERLLDHFIGAAHAVMTPGVQLIDSE